MTAFRHRGIIEGYYGPPYSHADRLWWIDRLGRWGLNLYVYAPKDDGLQRSDWRIPYPKARLREFAELVEAGASAGVEVGFSVSPGLSIEYASREDRDALHRKFGVFRELGVRFVSLGLDDVPTELTHEGDRRAFGSLAEAHVALAHGVLEALGPESTLWLVPTDYMGTEPTPYLEHLGTHLDAGVQVGWTGRTLVSPTVRAAEARQRAATLRRPLLLWDNFPVADGVMRPLLHLGPYRGRDPGLSESLCGIVLNTMAHAHASGVAVRAAAEYLRDPHAYDAEAAWRSAVAELGAGAEQAFALFASAHRFSALSPEESDGELADALGQLRASVGSGEAETRAREAFAAGLRARLEVAEALRQGLCDRQLAGEIEPWLESHRREGERMRAALEFLEALGRDGSRMERLLAVFPFEARVRAAASEQAWSYGPRRALYPQFQSLRDDEACFGPDPALFLDRCLADEVVRFAQQRASDVLGLRVAPAPSRAG
ncbi:MAG: beta-N-acetylglucosaminidase domain-containing protein [Myxococcota bacterium]